MIDHSLPSWTFYGRSAERGALERILARGRFFFCAISGRRRIGKTTLVLEALGERLARSALYLQIPDGDERAVVQVFRDALEDLHAVVEDRAKLLDPGTIRDFAGVAAGIAALCRNGIVVALDEFQYVHRASLAPFASYLQAEVDRLRDTSHGGIFVLGSIHTEMTAILEDRNSPLFNRVTDRLDLGHWDFTTLFEMFNAHGIDDPAMRLFLWSLFEGVPKFYRDAFDQGVLGPRIPREDILRRLFFEGTSPLRDEASNWFLGELRGRYESILRILARMQPCGHGVLEAEYTALGSVERSPLATYLRTLIERYRLVEARQPIFGNPHGRKARYALTDNFLSAWLAGIMRAVEFSRLRPIAEAVRRAEPGLMVHEGFAFEKAIRLLTEETSRVGRGGMALTEIVRGYWNKSASTDDSIEIDIVAIDEEHRFVRVGSCKRSASAHDGAALLKFDGHVARFLATNEGRRFTRWRMEKVLYSPRFSPEARARLTERGYICHDFDDYARWLNGMPE
jgi:AAA+ ATPase superfamily predicted ATPase